MEEAKLFTGVEDTSLIEAVQQLENVPFEDLKSEITGVRKRIKQSEVSFADNNEGVSEVAGQIKFLEKVVSVFTQGRIRHAMGCLDEGRDCYKKGINTAEEGSDEWIDCVTHLGILESTRKNIDEARRVFTLGVEKGHKEENSAVQSGSWINCIHNLGCLEHKAGDSRKADHWIAMAKTENIYRKHLLNPDDPKITEAYDAMMFGIV